MELEIDITEGAEKNEDIKEEDNESVKEEISNNEMANKVLSNIFEVVDKLDEIDSYFEKLSNRQSRVDEELSDLLHFIENPNNAITNKQASKLLECIRGKRIERRLLLNTFEIKKVFNENRAKLSYTSQRQFFLSAIRRKEKELDSQYKPRWLQEEDIKQMIK